MKEKIAVPKEYEIGAKDLKDVIAPAALEVNANYLKIGGKFAKTLFIFTYPRYLSSGWFSPIINLPVLTDISFFVHPMDTAVALRQLRKKAASLEAQRSEEEEKGLVRDPMLETAIEDIDDLRDKLQQYQERMFAISAYITIYADSLEELNRLEGQITSILESRLVYAKPALFQQIEGFSSAAPLSEDKLKITTPLNTSPVSSFFPFISLDLTSDEGILYGINSYNNGLIIFDRFSLENANMVVFAKAGAGKSYQTKLEIIRSLMFGTEVLVIDPENEYQRLAEAVGGSYFKISLSSEHRINPFDIPVIPEGEDPADVLKSHILNLAGLIKVMLGQISVEEDALLDKAIAETYASRDITPDNPDFSRLTPPLLEDLQAVLRNTEGGRGLATRLEKFTTGTYAGFLNKPSNVDIKNRFIVFNVRDLEEELRPIAMYIILHFIWNLIRAEFKKRVLIIDEAWTLMKHPDGASFLFGLAKRARKYYLGITTITQDVEDFMLSPYGRPIVTNSSLQLLLKQSPATIDVVAKTFNLTEGERALLLEAPVGHGLLFAGLKHAAVEIVASFNEHELITTAPEEILRLRQEGKL